MVDGERKTGRILGRTAVLACALLAAAPAMADWMQAVAYYKQGQYEKSLQELKPDLDKNPDWESGHRLAGLNYLGLKNNALAISELTRAVQLQSKAFVTYQALAQAYFNTDRIENCIQILNQGEQFAKDPNDLYFLHHLRGAAYSRLQKYDQADDDLSAAIRIKGSDWVDFSQLGIAYYNLDRYDEAANMMQKALALKPNESITSQYLAKTYFKQGVTALSDKQYAQASDLFKKASTYNPNDGYIFYNAGEAYLFSNNYPEAEKAYNQAQALLPHNANVFQRLGFLYERQKKWDLAEKAYNQSLTIQPRTAEVYQRLGIIYEEQKKWDKALSAYQKANEINPSPALKESIARVTELKKF
jgi:tetratricopeptide (TPR) repeat protein